MKTQKELLKEHRKQLDNKYKEKYPNGRFTIQRRPTETGIYWSPNRDTGSTKNTKGVGVSIRKDKIEEHNHQNNQFDKCTHYDSFDKVIRAAERFKLSQKIINLFRRNYERVRKTQAPCIVQERSKSSRFL